MLTETLTLTSKMGAAFEIDLYLKGQFKDNTAAVSYPTVLILPGGGFQFHSDREAEPIATKFNSEGYHAIVIRYALAITGPVYPQALLEIAEVMELLQKKQQDWHINLQQIAVIGFSAGGHVAAQYNGLIAHTQQLATYSLDLKALMPQAVILCYPVINFDLGYPMTEATKIAFSSDSHYWFADQVLTAESAPTFIWHTINDQSVPAENSIRYLTELKKQEVPFEVHLFASGKHGLSLATALSMKGNRSDDINPAVAEWFDLMITWLKSIQ